MCKSKLSNYFCIKVFAFSTTKKSPGHCVRFLLLPKNHHKFNGKMNLLSYCSRVQKSATDFTRLKLRCQLCSFLQFLMGESTYLPCLASRRCPIPWLLPCLLSLKSVQLHFIDPTSIITLFSLTFSSASPTFKDPNDYIEPTWIIQNNLFTLRLSNQQTKHNHSFWGLGCGPLWETIILPVTGIEILLFGLLNLYWTKLQNGERYFLRCL